MEKYLSTTVRLILVLLLIAFSIVQGVKAQSTEDCCDGKISQLTLKYLGSLDDAEIKVIQKKDAQVAFSGTVQPGEEFSFAGLDKKATFSTEIWIYVNGEENTRIHTSCSVPVGPGLVSGDFEVMSGESRNGGELCAISGDDGEDNGDDDHGDDDGSDDNDEDKDDCCDGKISQLTLKYLGSLDDAEIKIVQKKDAQVAFLGTVQPGEEFSFVGLDKKATFSTEIWIYVNGEENTRIHTSCSVPVGPGLVSGDFEVMSGESRNGGELCAIDSGDDNGNGGDDGTGDDGDDGDGGDDGTGDGGDGTGDGGDGTGGELCDCNCDADGLFEAQLDASDIRCFGDLGAINLIVAGGVEPYIFTWSNGASTQNLDALSEGTYSVTIDDASGAKLQLTGIIENPPLLEVTSVLTPISCPGMNDGAIALDISGGVDPYIIQWDNGDNTSEISGLSAGMYQATITDSNQCTTTSMYEIIEPAQLMAAISTTECNNGFLILEIIGGTSPYSYVWSTGARTKDTKVSAIGTYSVVVTDAGDCMTTQSIELTTISTLNVSVSTNAPTCFNGGDGSATVFATGTSTAFTYLWSTGATTETVTGLSPGAYTVTVKDENGCSASKVVFVPNSTPIFIQTKTTSISCNGANDGTINVTVFFGKEPYQYSWSNGETTEDLNNLAPGLYKLSVTDDNGCSRISNITIREPEILSAELSTDYCGDGLLELSISGGTAPFFYEWSTGESTPDITIIAGGAYWVKVTDFNGCTDSTGVDLDDPHSAMNIEYTSTTLTCFNEENAAIDVTVVEGVPPYAFDWSTGETTEDISGLSAGVYSVVISDASSCKRKLTISIVNPTPVVFQATALNTPSCVGSDDGSITVKTISGVAPFSFSWSNGETTQEISNLIAGDYTLTMTDANQCSTSGTFTLADPTAITIDGSSIAASCGLIDGSISLVVSGGIAPYNYLWSNGETSKDISGVAPGIYTVDVTDLNGCTFSTSIELLDDCNGGDGGGGDGGDGGNSEGGSAGTGTDDCDCICLAPTNETVDDSNSTSFRAEKVNVYPSPLLRGDNLIIQSTDTDDTHTQLRIYNMTGELMLSEKHEFSSGRISVRTSNFKTGVYIIEIQRGSSLTSKRFIVE